MVGRIVLVALGAFVIAACTIASPTHITVEPTKSTSPTDPSSSTSSSSGSSAKASGGAAVACDGTDYVQPDLSTLTACGNGKGHCYDADKTPTSDQLVACDTAGQVCVPDEILESAGNTLGSCSVKALGGKPGGCITASLYPTIIAQGGSALTQDACDAGQLCVPCNDPTNGNAATPFCLPIGVHASACGAAAATPDAGTSAPEGCCATDGVANGICIDEAAIPSDKRSSTVPDTCSDPHDRCVPKSLVDGNPTNCDGGFTGKGVCLDKCFNKWMGYAGDIGALKQTTCGATEVCVPCIAAGSSTPGCN